MKKIIPLFFLYLYQRHWVRKAISLPRIDLGFSTSFELYFWKQKISETKDIVEGTIIVTQSFRMPSNLMSHFENLSYVIL